ncbi:hypothetical protein AURDEDRAFT_166265 [Auricularia subglabra TFB-10046 SS5]|nr:hypothetical protein AURDEDRAFT_166265 [Auricularia subglabra TFB-10046 SS5]
MEAQLKSKRCAAHVSKACDYCRKRKIKCNGAKPICGSCSAAGTNTECNYSRLDGRAKTTKETWREQLVIAHARIAQLTAEVCWLREVLGRRVDQAGSDQDQLAGLDHAPGQPQYANATFFNAAPGMLPPAIPQFARSDGVARRLTGADDAPSLATSQSAHSLEFSAYFSDGLAPASISFPPALTFAAPPALMSNSIAQDATIGTAAERDTYAMDSAGYVYSWGTDAE